VSEPPSGETPGRQETTPGVPVHTPERVETLDDVLGRRVPLRVRVVQAIGLLVLVAVLAGWLAHALQTSPGAAQSAISAPSPTPVALGPVLVLSNVSSGVVTLNGVRLTESPPLVTTFRRGVNTLTMTAPPFHPLTCHVQWPSRQSDGACDLPPTTGLPHTVGGRPVSPVLVVVLPFGPEDLPSAAQVQALARVSDILQQTPPQTHVPVGQYIASGQEASGAILSRRTRPPLQARLLAAATTLAYFDEFFCADPGCVAAPGPPGSRLDWVVGAGVSIRWQFRSSAGEEVAISPPWSDELPVSLLLTYNVQQGWTVDQRGTKEQAGFDLTTALAQSVCDGGATALITAAHLQPGDTSPLVLHDNRLEGCELGLQTAQGANAGHFVWRFGVLLAADAPAHALLPDLPLAPPSEHSAVGASS
jgi:hypothetical protein